MPLVGPISEWINVLGTLHIGIAVVVLIKKYLHCEMVHVSLKYFLSKV